jgi:hypothetical protein
MKERGKGYIPTYTGKLFRCYLCDRLDLEKEKEIIRGLHYCHYCARYMDKPRREATKLQIKLQEDREVGSY